MVFRPYGFVERIGNCKSCKTYCFRYSVSGHTDLSKMLTSELSNIYVFLFVEKESFAGLLGTFLFFSKEEGKDMLESLYHFFGSHSSIFFGCLLCVNHSSRH